MSSDHLEKFMKGKLVSPSRCCLESGKDVTQENCMLLAQYAYDQQPMSMCVYKIPHVYVSE